MAPNLKNISLLIDESLFSLPWLHKGLISDLHPQEPQEQESPSTASVIDNDSASYWDWTPLTESTGVVVAAVSKGINAVDAAAATAAGPVEGLFSAQHVQSNLIQAAVALAASASSLSSASNGKETIPSRSFSSPPAACSDDYGDDYWAEDTSSYAIEAAEAFATAPSHQQQNVEPCLTSIRSYSPLHDRVTEETTSTYSVMSDGPALIDLHKMEMTASDRHWKDDPRSIQLLPEYDRFSSLSSSSAGPIPERRAHDDGNDIDFVSHHYCWSHAKTLSDHYWNWDSTMVPSC